MSTGSATSADARAKFTELVAPQTVDPSLGEIALWIAAEEYPGLNVEEYLGRLDRLAERVERVGRRLDEGPVQALRIVLAEEQGFHGNRDAYYDARNSFLNDVLDGRAGIPITLSILYLEVARRMGLEAAGVSFPGHFLLRIEHEQESLILDPFHGGATLSLDDCAGLFARATGNQIPFHRRFLQPSDWREIVLRMLTNLKGIYLADPVDLPRALAAVDRMLLVRPDALSQVRDRGLLLYRMEDYERAAVDLERVVGADEDERAGSINPEQLETLRRLLDNLSDLMGK